MVMQAKKGQQFRKYYRCHLLLSKLQCSSNSALRLLFLFKFLDSMKSVYDMRISHANLPNVNNLSGKAANKRQQLKSAVTRTGENNFASKGLMILTQNSSTNIEIPNLKENRQNLVLASTQGVGILHNALSPENTTISRNNLVSATSTN